MPSGATASYAYDAAGRRVQQTSGSTVTNYLWDEASTYGDVVLETDGNGVTQASYVLGDGQVLAQTRGGTTSYYLYDGQGSVRGLTAGNGSVTDAYDYDAFGNLLTSSGSTVNPYRYTGQQLDSLTGLYDLRARSYDPTSGRFLSRDTASLDFSNPVELNRYSYAEENPVNLADPSGHDGAPVAARPGGGNPLLEYATLILAVTGVIVIGIIFGVPPASWLYDLLKVLGGFLAGLFSKILSKVTAKPGESSPEKQDNWVVRGGTAAPDNLQRGYGPHPEVPGLYGFSVQYQPGKPVDELAQAGQFKNKQISYQTDTILIGTAAALGYAALLVPSPGPGYHADFEVLQNGVVLQQLPSDLATALSVAFIRMPNPFPAP